MSPGIRCMMMRGGTSKGGFFVASDLPADPAERDHLLMRIMGTPDDRQIDGMGGAHPLTTKVAVVSVAEDDRAGVEYLFLQLGVSEPVVTDRQNCGNMLAAVGPFAVERKLVAAEDGEAVVRIHMVNTGGIAVARFPVESGSPVYDGDTAISGVPGTAARISIDFEEVAGGTSGALLPTGNVTDELDGVAVTLIDNGMPVVVLASESVGTTGYESCLELESNEPLRRRLETIRLEAGQMMNLGDVSRATIPKLTMVSAPAQGGTINTRTFIPHRCHQAIGVLGAVSVATATRLDGGPARAVARVGGDTSVVTIEHPSGTLDALVEMDGDEVVRSGIVRTARKLMDGIVYPRSY